MKVEEPKQEATVQVGDRSESKKLRWTWNTLTMVQLQGDKTQHTVSFSFIKACVITYSRAPHHHPKFMSFSRAFLCTKLGKCWTPPPCTLLMTTPTHTHKKNAHKMRFFCILEPLSSLIDWILLAKFRGSCCLLKVLNMRGESYLLEVCVWGWGGEVISYWSRVDHSPMWKVGRKCHLHCDWLGRRTMSFYNFPLYMVTIDPTFS